MIHEMMNQFKELAELQEFAVSQHKTIVSQSDKIKQLEDEIIHLKRLLESTTPILNLDSPMTVDNEEVIARAQLNRLRDVSQGRELTLEEARKLEIYSKIITTVENRLKKNILPAKNLSNDQLIAALNPSE